jgi:HD-GYP domain-containing protein (c-di-GMP phosphodiesterase class II)
VTVAAAADLVLRLDQLNEVGVALSRERNINRLLEEILVAAKTITRADGGTLYRLTDNGQALRFEIVRTDSLKFALGGTSGHAIDFPDLPLFTADGQPNNHLVAVCAVTRGATINIADAYTEAGFDFSGTREFDRRNSYRSRSFLTVPMRNHEDEIIGVLQLLNAIDPHSGQVTTFSAADQRLAESLASQAAIALTNRRLIDQLEELFEAFIRLINVAIDEKSPYTAGHCQRVPVLTMLLADAADAITDGPLAGFHLSDKERYALKIAALLHDCGKITTPVHVVDKATKLQALFDRIALIDTRFEVIKRDAEIAALRQGQQAAEPALLAAIDADRQFLRHCNRGSEAMSPDDQERVRSIARSYRWGGPEGEEVDFLSADEIENLTIRAGTLTAAEREIINHHIVATIKMLEQLPWPKHLAQVPEYAGGHHERMDGKGYPKGLTGEQMSVPARIVAIADIYEALTASDRPYKEAMSVEEALAIMARFAQSGHIDPQLFEVFVRQRVYESYGRGHATPGHLDAV